MGDHGAIEGPRGSELSIPVSTMPSRAGGRADREFPAIRFRGRTMQLREGEGFAEACEKYQGIPNSSATHDLAWDGELRSFPCLRPGEHDRRKLIHRNRRWAFVLVKHAGGLARAEIRLGGVAIGMRLKLKFGLLELM